jgi:type IX secretion system PorP/SprF family membrane protein
MKKIIITLVFSAFFMIGFAQQDAQFSMNMFNRLSYNPAYAGMNNSLCGKLFFRQQWVGFSGAPETGLFSIDYGRVLGGGVGIVIDQDKAGFEKKLKAKVAYSYQVPGIAIGTLALGVDLGMIQQSISPDGDGFITSDGSKNDPSVPWGGSSVTTYDLGFGVYYKTRTLYVGLSALHIPAQTKSDSGTSQDTTWQSNFDVSRHYYLMAGYTFILNRSWEVTPSVFAKSVLSSTQVDLNVLAKYKTRGNHVYFGSSYRLGNAIIIMAGLERRFSRRMNAKFGYAYDISTSELKDHNSGSHEIMLGFCYKLVPDPKRTSHMNVRFL